MRTEHYGRMLVEAPAPVEAEVLVCREPLSLWGGLDPTSGRIIDPRCERTGEVVTGKVWLLPAGRGSSSASSVLLEAVRLRTAPLALLLREPDAILALGAIVARELYGRCPAVAVLLPAAFDAIANGSRVRLLPGGAITVST